jgi:hypothetical protein
MGFDRSTFQEILYSPRSKRPFRLNCDQSFSAACPGLLDDSPISSIRSGKLSVCDVPHDLFRFLDVATQISQRD